MGDATDFLKSAGGILASLAPTVASVLGGPFAGIATQKIIGALGLAPDASQKDVMQAIAAATPEQLIALKKAEAELLVDMKKLDVDMMALEQKDTESARKREVDTQDWTPRIIAVVVLAVWLGVQYYIFSGHILEASMRDFAMRSLGTLDAALSLILGYYFGSSLGSQKKNQQIDTLVKTVSKNGK